MFESLRTANLVVLVSIIVLFANDYFSSDHRFSTALSAHLDGRDQTREQIQSYQLLGTSIENLVGKNDTQSHETIISPPPPASGGIGLRQDVEAPSDATEHAGNTSILGTAGGPSDGKPGRLSVHETALSSWESSSVSSDRSSTDNNNNNSNHLISSGNTLGNSTIFSETSPTSKPHHDLSKHSANALAPTISLDHPPGFRRNQDEARAAERGTDHHYHHHRIASVALNNRANHQVVVVGSSGGDGRSISSSISSGSGSSHELLKRHAASMAQELNPDCEFQISRKPAIYGIRCDDSEVTEDGSIIIEAFKATRVYLIGRNLYSNLTVAITGQEGATQDDCTHADRIKSLRLYNLSLNIGEIIIELPPPEKSVPYYLCIREDTHDSRWYHQGSDPWLRIHVQQDFMPLWAKIITIIILLSMSGLFSGLNLGLMALDKNELQVIMKCGTEDEKHYATVIEPVRRRGNYLLCSILFSNTLVNSTISVFLEDLSDGLVAIMTSTILIVLFGEILPQAFCSRHGLAVGAKTIWLTHACMFLTFPLSYPVSYCLDWALGEEIGHAYDRERLMEFIQVTRDINNLEADEVNIISGALKIKRVQISEVMTRIEDVYMLDETALLDFDTIQAIVSKGYSRIPVHEAGNRRNIKAVLFAKDLALVDPDDRTPVKTMISFYNHPRMFVFEDTTLDKALNEFKTGKSHMAIVQRVIDDGDRDPYYEVTGIVTLEDVIEEIMQMEINDETDTLTDNRRKRRRKDAQVRKDFSQFTDLGMGDSSFNVVTPQLCLAAYQYLATSVEPFTPKYLSDSVLRRLLSQKIFYKVRLDDKESAKRLYTVGEPADYFIMILEGRVSVRCGKENLVFEGGPFSHYGTAALYNCDQLGESLAVSTSNPATTAPVTPGGSTGIVAQALAAATGSITGATARKDSVRPMLSRRESMAKIITSQLSLAPKKSGAAAAEQDQAAISGDLSPTGSARITSGADAGTGGVMETVELVERGSFYFKPDYTVDIITNTSYLKVTRNDYITALKATWVEREGAALLGEDVETTFTDLGPSCMYFEKQ